MPERIAQRRLASPIPERDRDGQRFLESRHDGQGSARRGAGSRGPCLRRRRVRRVDSRAPERAGAPLSTRARPRASPAADRGAPPRGSRPSPPSRDLRAARTGLPLPTGERPPPHPGRAPPPVHRGRRAPERDRPHAARGATGPRPSGTSPPPRQSGPAAGGCSRATSGETIAGWAAGPWRRRRSPAAGIRRRDPGRPSPAGRSRDCAARTADGRAPRPDRHRERLFEHGSGTFVLSEAEQDVADVRQIPADRGIVTAAPIDRERALRERERLLVASLVPAKQAEAPDGVTFERFVPALAAEAEGRCAAPDRRHRTASAASARRPGADRPWPEARRGSRAPGGQ